MCFVKKGRNPLPQTKMRQPGIEPGPLPWKGRILTIRPLTLCSTSSTRLVKGGTSENASQWDQTLQLGRGVCHMRCHNCDGASCHRMHKTVGVNGFYHFAVFHGTFQILLSLKTKRNPNLLQNAPRFAARKANSLSSATRHGTSVIVSSL